MKKIIAFLDRLTMRAFEAGAAEQTKNAEDMAAGWMPIFPNDL